MKNPGLLLFSKNTPESRSPVSFGRLSLLLSCLFYVTAACVSAAKETTVERITPEEAAESVGVRSLNKRADGLGCLEGDCENGKGTYAYSKKSIYKGEFANGKRNGQGTLEYENGDTYTGGFLKDLRSGQGKYLFANGDYYDGEFANGQRSGKGVYSFASGGVFEGEFQNDGKSGNGLFHLEDDKTLTCELRNYALFCEVEGKEALIKKLQGDGPAKARSQAQSPPRSFFEGNR